MAGQYSDLSEADKQALDALCNAIRGWRVLQRNAVLAAKEIRQDLRPAALNAIQELIPSAVIPDTSQLVNAGTYTKREISDELDDMRDTLTARDTPNERNRHSRAGEGAFGLSRYG